VRLTISICTHQAVPGYAAVAALAAMSDDITHLTRPLLVTGDCSLTLPVLCCLSGTVLPVLLCLAATLQEQCGHRGS
jgi:hypothetical protein